MLTSIFDTTEGPNPWFWNGPPGEPGDYERCQCFCHSPGIKAVHVMACCNGGWKATFQLIGKRYREAQERAQLKSTTYRPAHGGYPNADRTI